jgi:hypothetical protein
MIQAAASAVDQIWALLHKLLDSTVDVGVGFEHMFVTAKIESTFAGALAQMFGLRGIGQETGEHGGESGPIPGTERETGIPENFNEGTEIRGNDRQSPQHIFRDHETKNFSSKRRNHDYRRLPERGFQLRTVKAACEANLRIQLRLAGEIFQRTAFRPIADDQKFKRLSLLAQDTRSFEQQTHTFGGNEPSLKRKNWWNTERFRTWRYFGGFEPVRNWQRSR